MDSPLKKRRQSAGFKFTRALCIITILIMVFICLNISLHDVISHNDKHDHSYPSFDSINSFDLSPPSKTPRVIPFVQNIRNKYHHTDKIDNNNNGNENEKILESNNGNEKDNSAKLIKKLQSKRKEITSVKYTDTDHVIGTFPSSISFSDTMISALESREVQTALQEYHERISKLNNKVSKSVSSSNSISQFIKNGGRIPVVLLTCNRAQLLDGTLHSILQVDGISRENLILMQDGKLESIQRMAKKYRVEIYQNDLPQRKRGGNDGAARIATHYKWSLSKAFELRPDAPCIIIIEDDLLFSPDFYRYFEYNAALLEEDPSLMAISSWNDNGFKGKVNDKYMIQRTEYFPGLGWLLTRKLYKDELEEKWPSSHWDHWLRSASTHKGREIAYPQVPRTFHNGILGTFMDINTHNKYFRDIDYNRKEVIWNDNLAQFKNEPTYRYASASVYDARLTYLISQCHHVKSLMDLASTDTNSNNSDNKKIMCIWINVDPEPPENHVQEFQMMGAFFHLWHEHRRTSHRGVHEFYYNDKYILLLNTFQEKRREKTQVHTFVDLKPEDVPIIEPHAFTGTVADGIALLNSDIKLNIIPANKVNINCDDVCQSQQLKCDNKWFSIINTCDSMKKHFKCDKCVKSVGPDQPAYLPGQNECLISSHVHHSSCSAAHKDTVRICPCVSNEKEAN